MPVGVIGVVGGGIKELDGAASVLAGVVSGRDEGWRGILGGLGIMYDWKRYSKWSCYDEKKNMAASPKLKLTGTGMN